MHRTRDGHEYYVFVGGGLEENESPETAVVREAVEETTLTVKPLRLLYENDGIDNQHQYYYLCEIISGEAKLNPAGEEFGFQNETNTYKPVWVDIAELHNLPVLPVEIRDRLVEDIRNNKI